MSVKAIFCSVQDIGKTMKKTKKHYVWKINISSEDHIIELFNSTISGKKKIKVDGKIVFEGKKVLSNNFSYPIECGRQGLTITQAGDKFEMLINGRPFSHFYNVNDRETYEDSYNKNSYGFSKSIANKLGDKYNKDKGLRNNLEREEYSTRAKYDGQRYSANDERVASWNDVDKAVSSHRRGDYEDRRVVRSHTNFDDYGKGRSDEFYGSRQRKNSFEEQEELEYERSKTQFTRAKTFGVNKEFENRPQQSKNPSSFDNFGDFSNFNNGNKENVGTSSSNRNAAPKKNDFFDLDAADRKTGALDTQAQRNLFDFNAQPVTESQAIPQPNMNKTQSQPNPTPVLTNDLIDVHKPTLISSINELYKNAPQPEPQVQLQIQAQPQAQNQGTFDLVAIQANPEEERAKSEPAKKDLWNSNLVSLGDITAPPQNNTQQQNQSSFIQFNLPSNQGGMNTMSSNTNNNNMNMGMNNMNNMSTMNTNMNMNYSGQPIMGGMNMGMGMGMGFQSNMNPMNSVNSMNMGGFNTMGNMGNMGMMNNGMNGFGGMNNFGYNY